MTGRTGIRLWVAVVVIPLLVSCTPSVRLPGPLTGAPALSEDYFLARDGARLPLKSWLPDRGRPSAVIIALHGFNDYSNFFATPGSWLAARGIASYAYDQRGFGAAPGRGYWPGTAALIDDLTSLIELIRDRHPETPVYLLGESMGAAVIMVATTGDRPALNVAGVILSAPAVWGRSTMPWYQTTALWLSAHTMPGLTLTGRGLKIVASDNRQMLLALGRDPLVINKTRIDTLYGLTGLMDAALAAAADLKLPSLILYGKQDQIIPKEPTERMLASLPIDTSGRRKIVTYENGYHMLLRDLQAEVVWSDIADWVGGGL
ncbi:MAG TPA: alpha/beta hydrolase [Rhodospirillales bacterium]|nr:alpha/beta hydrolase [Rhodospirillales bacterium]